MKGLSVTDNIRRDEYKTKAEIRYPRETEECDAEFWAILGGKPATINPPLPDDTDGMEDAGENMTNNLYHISNATGKLLCTLVTDLPHKREHLDTNDCYILELSKHIYIWVGKLADV